MSGDDDNTVVAKQNVTHLYQVLEQREYHGALAHHCSMHRLEEKQLVLLLSHRIFLAHH
jgi:hypothetical protein